MASALRPRPVRRFGLWIAVVAVLAAVGAVAAVVSRARVAPSPEQHPAPSSELPTRTAAVPSPAPEVAAAPTHETKEVTGSASDAPAANPDPPLPAQVNLHVTSQPTGAVIALDGKTVGTTPGDVKVTRGQAVKVELRLRGRSVSSSVVPNADQDVLLVFPLEPRRSSAGKNAQVPGERQPQAPQKSDDDLPF